MSALMLSKKRRSSQRRFSAVVACVAVLTLSIGRHASAQTPDAAVNSLVADWRSEGVQVEIGSATPLSDHAGVLLRNVVINFTRDGGQSGSKLSLEKLELSGTQFDAAHIAVGAARGEGIRLTTDSGKLSIARMTLDHMSAVRLNAPDKGRARSFQSLVDALDHIFRTEWKSFELNDVAWESASGSSSVVTANRITATDFKAGNIARIVIANPKSADNGALRASAADMVTIENFSPVRFVEIFNSGTIASGVRDWKSLTDSVTVAGYLQSDKAAKARVEQIQLSGLKVRRFASDPSKLFELVAMSPNYLREHPEEGRKLGEALMDVVKLDRVTVKTLSGTDGNEQDGRRFGFDVLEFKDLDPLRAGAITLANFNDHRGENGLHIGQASVGGIEFLNVGAPSAEGVPPAKTLYVAKGAITDVKFVQPGNTTELGDLEWSAEDRQGIFPTRVNLTVSDFKAPAAFVPDPVLRNSLIKSGTNFLAINLDVSASWDGAREQIDLDHANLDVSDIGRIEIAGSLTGVSKIALDSGPNLKAAALDGALKSLKVRYTDLGLLRYALDAIAAANKQQPDQIRKALSANMPVILGAIPDASNRASLTFALISFLNDPATLEFASLAQTPVPVGPLLIALRESPSALPGLLKLNATAIRKH